MKKFLLHMKTQKLVIIENMATLNNKKLNQKNKET